MDDTTQPEPAPEASAPIESQEPEPKAKKGKAGKAKPEPAPEASAPGRGPGEAVRVIVRRATVNGPDRRPIRLGRFDVFVGPQADYLAEHFPQLVEPYPPREG